MLADGRMHSHTVPLHYDVAFGAIDRDMSGSAYMQIVDRTVLGLERGEGLSALAP